MFGRDNPAGAGLDAGMKSSDSPFFWVVAFATAVYVPAVEAAPDQLTLDTRNFPTLGTVHRLDPRLESCSIRPRRSRSLPRVSTGARGRCGWRIRRPVERGASPVFGDPVQHSAAMGRGQRTDPVFADFRLHRTGHLQQGARLERPGDRCPGAPGVLRAWRPPAVGADSRRRQTHAGGRLRGEAIQQPERPDDRAQRRHLFHRSAVRSAERGG